MTDLRLGVVLAAVLAAPASTQDAIHDLLAGAVKEDSSERIEATVRTLCGFGTRHPLSDTESDTTGTGAARKWLMAAYQEIAASSNGRLQVAFQTATVPCRRRVGVRLALQHRYPPLLVPSTHSLLVPGSPGVALIRRWRPLPTTARRPLPVGRARTFHWPIV